MIYSENHNKSDYDFRVYAHVIAIKDLNFGRMSVTNNIESIVKHICEQIDLDPLDFTIIYSDSEGIINEFRWKDKSFHAVNKFEHKKAIALIQNI